MALEKGIPKQWDAGKCLNGTILPPTAGIPLQRPSGKGAARPPVNLLVTAHVK